MKRTKAHLSIGIPAVHLATAGIIAAPAAVLHGLPAGHVDVLCGRHDDEEAHVAVQVDCGSPSVLLGRGGIVLEDVEVLERLGLLNGCLVQVYLIIDCCRRDALAFDSVY